MEMKKNHQNNRSDNIEMLVWSKRTMSSYEGEVLYRTPLELVKIDSNDDLFNFRLYF